MDYPEIEPKITGLLGRIVCRSGFMDRLPDAGQKLRVLRAFVVQNNLTARSLKTEERLEAGRLGGVRKRTGSARLRSRKWLSYFLDRIDRINKIATL